MRKANLGLLALLVLIVIMGLGTVKVSADVPANYNYSFDIINIETGKQGVVSGTPGTALASQTLRIRLNGATTKRDIAKGTEATYWIACMNAAVPDGLKIKVAEDVPAGSAWIDVTFYGTVYTAIWDEFRFMIPKNYLFEDGSAYDYYDAEPSVKGKFNIVREGTSGARQVTFSPDELILSGTVGTAVSARELTVTLNGVFFRSISAGTDITDWFKGRKTIITNNGTILSFIPKGITVKVKNKVEVYSNTMTLVFSGKPTEASIDAISFTIPAGYAAIKDESRKSEVKSEFTTPIYTNNKYRYSITGPNGYLRQGVVLDCGDTHLNAMVPIDPNNPVMIHATLFGNDESGNPLKLRGTYSGQKLSEITQNATMGGLKEYYGVEGVIRNWTDGETEFDIELSGKPKEDSYGSYPKNMYVSFEMLPKAHTGELNLKTEQIGTLTLEEPKLNVTTTPVIKVSCPIQEAGFVYDSFVINLGNDYLTEDIAQGTNLAVGYSIINGGITQVVYEETSYNGIGIQVREKASRGSRSISVRLTGKPNRVGSGYIPVAFRCSQLENFSTAKKQEYVVGLTGIKYEVWDKDTSTPPDGNENGGEGGSGSGSSGNDEDDDEEFTEEPIEEDEDEDAYGRLRYPVKAHVKNYAKVGDKQIGSVYIDMTDEKLVCGKAYKCYSIDGGRKWKQGSIGSDLSKLLNKGISLVLATDYDQKTKAPTDKAKLYVFTTTNKRPAAPKFGVDYLTFADNTGKTAGQFVLTDKSGEALSQNDIQKYAIAVSADGKKADAKGFGKWPLADGVYIPTGNGAKQETAVYLVKTAPTEDTPASKESKVKVKGLSKAPNIKVDYKNEVIKLKKGMVIFFGEEIPARGETETLSENAKTYSDFAGRIFGADSAEAPKSGLAIGPYITNTRNKIIVWTMATAKKPASKPQVIELAARAPVGADGVTVSNGKLTLDKKYEVYNEAKDKWGSCPKITESCELTIRLKATAKGGKESAGTFAASSFATLSVTYGVYDEEKNKEGVITAQIVPK